MTAWYEIAETETDPGAPSKSELWKAWSKNPIAMGEGSEGAPKVYGSALNDVYLGYERTTSDVYGSGFDFSSRSRFLFVELIADAPASGTSRIQVSFSTDGGTTWGGDNAVTGLLLTAVTVKGAYDLLDGTFSGMGGGQTVTVPADINAVRFKATNVALDYFAWIVGGKDP